MERLNQYIKEVEKNGFDAQKAIEALKQIREDFKTIEKPLCVKMCRLAYEYIENNEVFDVDVLEERDEEVEGNTYTYFLTLMTKPDNEYNKEELREYAELLA